jgi:hypothetical protein
MWMSYREAGGAEWEKVYRQGVGYIREPGSEWSVDRELSRAGLEQPNEFRMLRGLYDVSSAARLARVGVETVGLPTGALTATRYTYQLSARVGLPLYFTPRMAFASAPPEAGAMDGPAGYPDMLRYSVWIGPDAHIYQMDNEWFAAPQTLRSQYYAYGDPSLRVLAPENARVDYTLGDPVLESRADLAAADGAQSALVGRWVRPYMLVRMLQTALRWQLNLKPGEGREAEFEEDARHWLSGQQPGRLLAAAQVQLASPPVDENADAWAQLGDMAARMGDLASGSPIEPASAQALLSELSELELRVTGAGMSEDGRLLLEREARELAEVLLTSP